MQFPEAVLVALISAVVAFLTTLAVRWWDRRQVRWIVTGEAHEDVEGRGEPIGKVRINLQLHNVGDGDAYEVRIRRCNGGSFEPWVTFDAPVVRSGDSIPVRFLPDKSTWETAWMEVTARSSPVGRRRPKTFRRVMLRDVTGKRTLYGPDSNSLRAAEGIGMQLPPERGGELS